MTKKPDNNQNQETGKNDAQPESHKGRSSFFREKDGRQDAATTDSRTGELEQKIGELTQASQRERADAMNIRRRHDEQIQGMSSAIKANVVRELLPVIDNFDRALKHVPKELEGNDFVKGVQGIVKQFEKSLQDLGVERIKTVGEVFDPRFHEAVSMDEADGGSQEIVSEELQSGYRIGDEVIRHAMVKVKLQ